MDGEARDCHLGGATASPPKEVTGHLGSGRRSRPWGAPRLRSARLWEPPARLDALLGEPRAQRDRVDADVLAELEARDAAGRAGPVHPRAGQVEQLRPL